MDELKELSKRTKEFTKFLTECVEEITRSSSKFHILASDEINLKQRVVDLNAEVAKLEKEKADVEKFIKSAAQESADKARKEAKAITDEARKILEGAEKTAEDTAIQQKKVLYLLKSLEVQKQDFDAKEAKIKKLEETLKSYA